MKKSLLKYMCCPSCKRDLDLKVKTYNNKEIISGRLICSNCKKEFHIKNGIPIVLEGRKLKDFSKTKSNWENWWSKVRKKSDIYLYDALWTKAEKNLSAESLYRKQDFKGKVVLDVGCGNGRHIQTDFSKFRCKEIIAVDLSNQVFLAKRNNAHFKNTHFLQADLTNLPFKEECLDVIASHGVLHHTPNPKKTFTKLSKHLKVGGMFALYVYHKEWAHFKSHNKSLLLDALYANGVLVWQSIRKITSRLPHPLLVLFCCNMAVKGMIEQALQKNKLTQPLGKIMQLMPPFAYIGVNFHERLVRNYDHYSATFNHFSTIEEVIDWFSSNNFNDLEIASVPISVRGYKQAKKEKPLRIKQYNLIDHFKFRKEWEKEYKKKKKIAR